MHHDRRRDVVGALLKQKFAKAHAVLSDGLSGTRKPGFGSF